MSGLFTPTDIANANRLDIHTVLAAIQELGYPKQMSEEQAKAVTERCLDPYFVLQNKMPSWVITAFISVYERAYQEGYEAAAKAKTVTAKIKQGMANGQ